MQATNTIETNLSRLVLSKYLVASDPLNDASIDTPQRVIFSTRSSECLVVPESYWSALQNQSFDLSELNSNLLNQLIEFKVLVDKNEDELNVVLKENNRAISSEDALYQVIQPSAWCQLDCHYCGQEHTKDDVSVNAQEAFLERVEQRLSTERYKHLEIGWFGAEPTMAVKSIRRISAKLQALAAQYGCSYSGRMISNGHSLNLNIAQTLVDQCSIREVEITLDGTQQYHDQRRLLKKGGGSYDRIIKNVLDVVNKSNMQVTIRCNVDIENVDGVEPLILELAELGLADKIQFYTAQIHSWGNDAHLKSMTKDEYALIELDWIALQISLGFKAGLIPARKKIVCMSVRDDSELLDANDNSFNCTEVSYVPTYGEPNIYATRTPGERKFRESKAAKRLAEFNIQVSTGEQHACSVCRMLPVCGGQCPKAWAEGHEPCPSAKSNISQRLNMFYALNKIMVNQQGETHA